MTVVVIMMIDDYGHYDEEFKWFHICITAVGTYPGVATLMTSAAKTNIIIIVTINETWHWDVIFLWKLWPLRTPPQ